MKTPVLHSARFALIGLVFLPLAVVHASSSPASPHHIATLKGHADWILSMAFSPDGATLASVSSDGPVKLWDVKTRRNIATLSEGGALNFFVSVAFSPDGATLAYGSNRGVELWDVATSKNTATLRGNGAVAFSPDGTMLASMDSFAGLKLWDVATGTNTAILAGHTGGVQSVAFSSDGAMLASGAQDNTVKLWDVETGRNIATLGGHLNHVWSVAFSSDGAMLASGSSDGTARLWDVATRQTIAILGPEDGFWPVAFLPDGEMLASGSNSVKLWNVLTKENIATFKHEPFVNSVVFSPDGAVLASGSFDGTIKLWDTSEWVPPRPQRLVKIGDGQRGPAGTQLAAPFVVSALDEDGKAFVGAVVTFSVTAGGGTLSAATATTDANGRAATTLTLGPDPGPNAVTTTVAGLEPVTFTATATGQIPHSLTKVSGDGQGGLAGEPLAKPFIVSVLDQNGEAFAGAVVSFSVTTGEGTLSAATATTDANGRAKSTLRLGPDPGPNAVTTTVAGLGTVTFTATATGQIPHSLTKVSGDGQEGLAGAQLDEPFVVLVLDEDDEAIAGAVVSFSVTGGGGTMSAATAATNANGRARNTLRLGPGPGPNTVEATIAGLEPVTFTAVGQESNFAGFDDFFGSGKRVALPDHTQLLQNAPNPFNSQTVLAYFLLEPSPVRLEVFALSGQRVALIHQGPQRAGYHRLHWDGRDAAGHPVASGAYLYRLATDEAVLTQKLTLIR